MRIPSDETPATNSQEPEEGRTPEPEEAKGQREEMESLIQKHKAEIDAHSTEIVKLRASRERYANWYLTHKDRIGELTRQSEEDAKSYRESSRKWDQRTRALEAELAQTKELLAARSTELSGAQSFLSMTDRLSEAEVLGLVRDLNENIFQVAANLTEEWEKLRSSSRYRNPIPTPDFETVSRAYGRAIVGRVRRRHPAALTFLVQSYLCDVVMQLTSSWHCNKELNMLSSVYNQLSAIEGQAISARWRSLAHNYLPEPSSHSNPIVARIADILWITGLFSTKDNAFHFVKGTVQSRIETIDRLAVRLESVFMVDITSCDMHLLFENPGTEFDDTRMTEEFEPDGDSTPKKGQDKVVVTTEVGVMKSVGRRGEPHHTQVLSKAKVILEKDLVDL